MDSIDNVVERTIPVSPERIAPIEYKVLPEVDGFNATTFKIRCGDSSEMMRVVLYRRPIKDIPQERQPDYNQLEASIVEGELTAGFKVRNQVVIWSPEVTAAESSSQPSLVNYEDIRAGEHGFCGLTVVEKTSAFVMPPNITGPTNYIPYPGIVRLPDSLASAEEAFGQLPEVTILRSLGPGKDVTPIEDPFNPNPNQETFLFRPESKKEENNHKLRVVRYDEKTKVAEVVDELVFPKTSWSQWRMGTAAGLFWLDEKHAILPIHGINKEPTLTNAEGVYNYSLGVALIERDEYGHLKVVKVADKPLIVPSQLDHLGIGERFPGYRSVVYSCGVWLEEAKDKKPEGSVLRLLVNKGDKGTVIATVPLQWVISSLISPEENLLANAA
jgi:hypothetical protein